MAQDIHIHSFPNGMTLLAERMEHVRSAAVNFIASPSQNALFRML